VFDKAGKANIYGVVHGTKSDGEKLRILKTMMSDLDVKKEINPLPASKSTAHVILRRVNNQNQRRDKKMKER